MQKTKLGYSFIPYYHSIYMKYMYNNKLYKHIYIYKFINFIYIHYKIYCLSITHTHIYITYFINDDT